MPKEFPSLTLTPFEHMMLVEDRPDYPMVARVEVTLSGEIDRPRFLAAYHQAIALHPLLSARVEDIARNPPRWVPGEPQDLVWIEGCEPTADRVCSPIDLTTSAGLRIRLCREGATTLQIIEIHHACTDGAGLLAFLRDWYQHYTNQLKQSENTDTDTVKQIEPVSFEALAGRNTFPNPQRSLIESIKYRAFAMRETLKFSLRRIAPLSLPSLENSPAAQSSCLHLPCESQLLIKLRKAAAASHCTLNDLLARDLLLTVQEWNQGQADHCEDDRYRLLIPCDLRTPEHVHLPACNVLSYAFLTRWATDCNRSDATLQGVRDEMRFIRDQNASLLFIRGLEFCRNYLGGVRRLASPQRCFATAMLSNLGNPLRTVFADLPQLGGKSSAGNLTVENMVAYPPLRPETHIAIVVSAYANRLSLGLRYNAHRMSQETATEVIDFFRQNLEKTAATAD